MAKYFLSISWTACAVKTQNETHIVIIFTHFVRKIVFLRQCVNERAICYHIETNELISLKITCNTPVRILLRPYLARGHQCIRKGTSLYTKFSLYSSLNSLFPVTLVSIDMELWLPSRMMTSTFCRFV